MDKNSAEIYDSQFQVYAKGENPGLLKYLKPNQTVLDVGCSDGSLGLRIRKVFKSKVYGIDVSPKAIETAKNNLDLAILADASFDALNLDDDYFDVIIFADVLEHVYDARQLLIRMERYLKPGGYYLISVPNIANWYIRLKLLLGIFDYAEQGILDKTHIRFYTLKTIESTLKNSGFRISRISALRGVLVAIGFQRFLSKIRLHWLYLRIDNFLANYWKRMFAQQFIILAIRDNE